MALTNHERIDLVQMAMKRVNVVPYGQNSIEFGTNTKRVDISSDQVVVCEAYINVTEENHTCHIGFSVLLSDAVNAEFAVEVDGVERTKKYKNSNQTMQFMDFFLLGIGLHSIVVKATAESLVTIAPREAQLGVYL